MKRKRYQFGSVQRKKRANGPDVWVFRYYENGAKPSVIVGTVKQYPTYAKALQAAESFRMEANASDPGARGITFGAALDRYEREDMPQRHSTSDSYGAYIRAYIRPKWQGVALSAVKPFAVEQWLGGLKLEPKSKGHIKTIMSNVFRCAMRWELLPIAVNPMSLVRVKGVTKRSSKAPVLTVEQVKAFIGGIEREPFRTMAWLSVGLGLERSVVVGLRWRDINDGSIYVRTGIVDNVEGPTKNDYRSAPLPLDPALAEMLAAWKQQTDYISPDDWVFASPYFKGKLPYNPRHVAIDHFWPAAKAAGLGERLGWQTLRRTYSSLLAALGVNVKVQQALMRHNDPKTTLRLYTDAYTEDMRAANSLVVGRIM